MLYLSRFSWQPLAVLILFAAGCGKPAGAPVGGAADRADAAASHADGTADAAGLNLATVKTAAPLPPATADAAVRAVVDGLRENRPQAVWEFLPAGYQKDVNDLVRDFAHRMDAEVWNRGFGTLKRAVRILKTKKELILAHPFVQEDQARAEALAANWDGLVDLADMLINSEMADLKTLKTLDVGAFLAKTGGRLMTRLAAASAVSPDDPFQAKFLGQLEGIRATVVASNGLAGPERVAGSEQSDGPAPRLPGLRKASDPATLRKTSHRPTHSGSDADTRATVRLELPGEPPQEVEFVKVEGKWIPRNLAEGWDQRIVEISAALSAITPRSIAANKPLVLEKLDAIDQHLTKLEEAETSEEFQTALAQAVAPLIVALQFSNGINSRVTGAPGGPSAPEPSAPLTVTVLVNGKIDKAQADQLAEKLFSLSDNPEGSVIASMAQAGGIRFDLSPVKDVEAFAKRIDFGKVAAVDAEKRIVTVELTKPETP